MITEPEGRRTYHQRVVRRREDDCAACDAVAEVDGGIGCCMMYRRDVALELGGYDPGWAPGLVRRPRPDDVHPPRTG